MNYKIFCAEKLIGESKLEFLDPSMGVAHGPFSPTDHYEDVQDVFRLFTDACLANDNAQIYDQYYKARDQLPLSLENIFGQIIPTTCIHIIDFSYETGDYLIEITVNDADVFHTFFLDKKE